MSTIVGTNIEVTNIKFDSDTTSMIISNTGQITAQGEGTATINVQQGLCKHWCDFDTSGTIAVRDSFNNSSITDNASGYSSLGYTNNFANQDYVGSGGASGSGNGSPAVMSDARATKLTSGIKVRHLHGTSNASVNPDDVMHHIHGDLS